MRIYSSGIQVDHRQAYPSISMPPPAPRPRPAADSVTVCIERYNCGNSEPRERKQFFDTYRVRRLGVSNASERMRSKHAGPPRFCLEPHGDYMVVDHENGRFLVMPRFGLHLTDMHFGPGGMGEVFTCEPYQETTSIHTCRLVAPANFQHTETGAWRLQRSGKLFLTPAIPSP